MAHTATLTVRVPVELKAELDALAQATDRSASWLTVRALQRWIEENRWQVDAIRDGIQQAESGALIDHDRVEVWLETWGTERESEPPR